MCGKVFLEDRHGTESFGCTMSENNGWMRVAHGIDNIALCFPRPRWIAAVGDVVGHCDFGDFNCKGFRITQVHPTHIEHSEKNKTHNLWVLFNKVCFNKNEPREIMANCSH